MTNILAIDTATAACSSALLCSKQQFSEFKLEPQSHTRLILPMIDSLLKQANISLKHIDAIAFTHGPGSFTGIRIGFGVVQGLALGVDIPVIPVSTLELMALTAARKCALKQGQRIFPLLDARMQELYSGQYQYNGYGELKPLKDDQLITLEDVFHSTTLATDIWAVGDGWNLVDTEKLTTDQVIPEFYPEAQDLLSVATSRFEAGKFTSIKGLEPLYLRDRITWKKRQRLGVE